MLAKMTQRRAVVLVAVALLSIVGAGVLFLSFGRTFKAETTYWPTLTMVYEKDGQNYNGTVIRETHRLEYNSASDWTDTVIASDPIESLALGTITSTGSYMRWNGDEIKIYDSISDDAEITQEPDTTYIPNQFLAPLDIFEEGADPESEPTLTKNGEVLTQVSTTSRVCYQSDCESSASGLAYNRGGGIRWIVLDDTRWWGIPLKVGDKFIVSELTLDVSKN